jgi:hypothetical protein
MLSCSEDKAREAARQQALMADSVITAVSPASPTPATVGELIVRIPKVQGTSGQQVCVPVTVGSFQDVVSMQYTHAWNPDILKFNEVKNFGLPGLGSGNFGQQQVAKGKLTYSWFEPNIRGVSLADGATIYEVCFEVVGKSGNKTELKFTEEPVIFEVSNSQSKLLKMKNVDGSVDVK